MAAKTGSKKAGRDVEKGKRYRNMKTREKNKIKRVLKSSGAAAAERYAESHGMSGYLKGLLKVNETVLYSKKP